jgi:glutamyl-tRNA reductase
MVVGLNHRSAPLAMRERFWIGEGRRYDVLGQLKRAEGVEEVMVLSTAGRTEFFLWAAEPTLAANSILQFLTSAHGLRLSEWEHFYRLLDDAALAHIFRIASGLDSLVCGEPQIATSVNSAWEQAQTVGAAGPCLNAVVETALRVAERVGHSTASDQIGGCCPAAAVEVARQIFGSVEGRKVLSLGASEISECAGREFIANGASLVVVDPSQTRAQELALALGGIAATLAERWKYLLCADIVVAASGCPHVILTREEAEYLAQERNRVTLAILDLNVPRDVDPQVRHVDGILLHDIESLQRAFEGDTERRRAIASEGEKIIAAEVAAFGKRLNTDEGALTTMNLRRRLDELCRQELNSFLEERGPFSREQDRYLHAVTGQLTQRIASFLAQELREVQEKEEQERMAAAISRLFHLDSPHEAIAGTISEKHNHAQRGKHVVAING